MASEELSLAYLVRHLAGTATGTHLDEKKMVCCALNGYSHENYLDEGPYGPFAAPVIKPQWVHSATAIYLSLRHPRISNPLTEYIRKEGIVELSIKLALDVLLTDVYALRYTQKLDADLKEGGAANPVFDMKNGNDTLSVKLENI